MSFAKINDDILRTLRPPGTLYYAGLMLAFVACSIGLLAFLHQARTGLGVAGYAHPMLWGIYITNFVFWVGIAHSGTLISAVLFLFRAKWRTAVARASEAMTVFAVVTAGLFPIIHIGRPWFFYWLISLPERARALGELPFAADLGRLRHHHLSDGERYVPLSRIDARPGRSA